jgi:hypothetical protein
LDSGRPGVRFLHATASGAIGVSTGLRKNQPKIIVLRLDERRKADIIGDGLRASKSQRLLRGITVGSKKPSSPRKNDGEK